MADHECCKCGITRQIGSRRWRERPKVFYLTDLQAPHAQWLCQADYAAHQRAMKAAAAEAAQAPPAAATRSRAPVLQDQWDSQGQQQGRKRRRDELGGEGPGPMLAGGPPAAATRSKVQGQQARPDAGAGHTPSAAEAAEDLDAEVLAALYLPGGAAAAGQLLSLSEEGDDDVFTLAAEAAAEMEVAEEGEAAAAATAGDGPPKRPKAGVTRVGIGK